jgi:cysteine desulfurase
MKAKPVYLDHAAATPLDPQVLHAMQSYLGAEYYNPSSLYQAARQTRQAVEAARHQVADVLGAKKSEIIFTSSATESVNLALFGVSGNLVTTTIEHEAVLACLPELENRGHQVTVVPVKPDGLVDMVKLEKEIDDETVLVSVMYANNEIGTVQPIAEIGKLIAQIRSDRVKRAVKTPLYFHTDATQAPNYLDLHVSRLGVDLMTLNGSKIYGPKGSGCLYVRTGVQIEPLVYGGGQEKGLRSGTENVAGIIGFAEALRIAQEQREAESKRVTELRDKLLADLQVAIPDLILNGHIAKRLANNINLTIPGISGETAVLYLDREGFQVSTGSACTTGNTEPSHVLLALGRSVAEANASLRITLGRGTTTADTDRLAAVLPKLVTRLRQLS